MPYIITTKRPTYADYNHESRVKVTRRAVAMLEEARAALVAAGTKHGHHASLAKALADSADRPRWSGGTVGPLPDGTVIEVEGVSLVEMYSLAGFDYCAPEHGMVRLSTAIDAYNARQSS